MKTFHYVITPRRIFKKRLHLPLCDPLKSLILITKLIKYRRIQINDFIENKNEKSNKDLQTTMQTDRITNTEHDAKFENRHIK